MLSGFRSPAPSRILEVTAGEAIEPISGPRQGSFEQLIIDAPVVTSTSNHSTQRVVLPPSLDPQVPGGVPGGVDASEPRPGRDAALAERRP